MSELPKNDLLALMMQKKLVIKTFKKGVYVSEDGLTAIFSYSFNQLDSAEKNRIIALLLKNIFRLKLNIKDVVFFPWYKIGKLELDGLFKVVTDQGEYMVIFEAKWNSPESRFKETEVDGEIKKIPSQIEEYYEKFTSNYPNTKTKVLYITQESKATLQPYAENITWDDLARTFSYVKENHSFIQYVEMIYRSNIIFRGFDMDEQLKELSDTHGLSAYFKYIQEVEKQIDAMIDFSLDQLSNGQRTLEYVSTEPGDDIDYNFQSGFLFNIKVDFGKRRTGLLGFKISFFNNDESGAYHSNFEKPFVTILFYPDGNDSEWSYNEINFDFAKDEIYSAPRIIGGRLATFNDCNSNGWAFVIPLFDITNKEKLVANVIRPIDTLLSKFHGSSILEIRANEYSFSEVQAAFSDASEVSELCCESEKVYIKF
ncbi:hypothetical protein Dacet_2643 [Denitrovibrio acetiphilus DSM 12809]|jgi:hypothetical protein|uniref:PD-(D/E)XK nuclease superfamily protein n=1 Tax=Denitrovibrio acetiphilus (strain DSM 12809 / NBRC 114555 / N2460) TaxID=522772 RepID=D4H545_DENA2|nr:hypothetical protein [Denitrovibrio acetiphilus]ADD69401.1 hypothetical protein Dacet_2643 [Denitrovibrio acetiphilus DSM 12809]